MKMIVLDLDGTLLTSDKTIGKKTFASLMEAQKQGMIIVLASGRPLSGILEYAYELELDQHNGYIIAYNGARLVRVSDLKTLWERVIKIKEAKQILKHLENYDVIPMISDNTHMYVNDVYHNKITYDDKIINIIKYEARNSGVMLCEQKSLSEFLHFDLYKILVAGDSDYLLQNHKHLSKPFSYNAMFTAPFYYEFTHHEADKGLALQELCDRIHVPLEDVVGFGDDLNDLPFLKLVGESVAMKNANPKVKKEVDHICGGNNEDGIAKYLNQKLEVDKYVQ